MSNLWSSSKFWAGLAVFNLVIVFANQYLLVKSRAANAALSEVVIEQTAVIERKEAMLVLAREGLLRGARANDRCAEQLNRMTARLLRGE